MSHNVAIHDLKISDLSALRAAIDNLAKAGAKLSLEVGNGPRSMHFRTYHGQDDRCEAVIRLPNERYDVGLVKNAEGAYVPVYDATMMQRNATLSCAYTPGENYNDKAGIGKLMQEYALVLAEMEAGKNGHMSVRVPQKDGSIALEIEVAD